MCGLRSHSKFKARLTQAQNWVHTKVHPASQPLPLPPVTDPGPPLGVQLQDWGRPCLPKASVLMCRTGMDSEFISSFSGSIKVSPAKTTSAFIRLAECANPFAHTCWRPRSCAHLWDDASVRCGDAPRLPRLSLEICAFPSARERKYMGNPWNVKYLMLLLGRAGRSIFVLNQCFPAVALWQLSLVGAI